MRLNIGLFATNLIHSTSISVFVTLALWFGLIWPMADVQAQLQKVRVTVLLKSDSGISLGKVSLTMKSGGKTQKVLTDSIANLMAFQGDSVFLWAECAVCEPQMAQFLAMQDTTLVMYLFEQNTELEGIEIVGSKRTWLKSVDHFGIYEGKKTEVVNLQNIDANTSTNNARQIYARITGLNIWESDQAGLQLGIGGRGLSPNRTSSFNVRQNGYDISADALGYPESYYTPPAEALDRIEIVRGAASLQYGTQFGGMVNFRFKRGPRDRKFQFLTRQTGGSWGFFGSFNSIAGQVGKLNYYAYFQYRRGNGYRANSGFDYYNSFVGLEYTLSKKGTLEFEYTYMHYLAQQAGGLTDRLFTVDPRQSVRARNWFQVDWNIFALMYTHSFSKKVQLNVRSFGLLALRQSVGNLDKINVVDFGGDRTLIDGQFRNMGMESRLLNRYALLNQHHTLLVGLRLYRGNTTARQGNGSDGDDANFTFNNPNDIENSDYTYPNTNAAVFAENIFQLSPKWSFTPGVRFEYINTQAEGYYKQYVIDGAGNIIVSNTINESLERRRSFLLFGGGLSYKQGRAAEWYANISQNYRAINFSDLRIDNPNLRVDPNIQDESGYTADLGIRGLVKKWLRYELTFFYINYQDKIGQVLRTDSVLFNDYRYRTNVSDARNVGVESMLECSLSDLFAIANEKLSWSVFQNLAVIDARYINTEDKSIENKKVEMVPPYNIKWGMRLKYAGLSTSVQYTLIGQHFSDASNSEFTATAVEGIIPSYRVLDWTMGYEHSFWRIEFSLNNALNESYFTRRADSYPGPGIIPADGRAYYLTLQGKF